MGNRQGADRIRPCLTIIKKKYKAGGSVSFSGFFLPPQKMPQKALPLKQQDGYSDARPEGTCKKNICLNVHLFCAAMDA